MGRAELANAADLTALTFFTSFTFSHCVQACQLVHSPCCPCSGPCLCLLCSLTLTTQNRGRLAELWCKTIVWKLRRCRYPHRETIRESGSRTGSSLTECEQRWEVSRTISPCYSFVVCPGPLNTHITMQILFPLLLYVAVVVSGVYIPRPVPHVPSMPEPALPRPAFTRPDLPREGAEAIDKAKDALPQPDLPSDASITTDWYYTNPYASRTESRSSISITRSVRFGQAL